MPTKKIICTVTNDLTYDQRMIRICNSLVDLGYEVLLVGRILPESLPLQNYAFEQYRLKCRYQKGKLFYLEFNLRLLRFLKQRPFDIICAVDLDTLAAGFMASRFRRKPCVYDAHEYFTELPEVVDRPFTRTIWSLMAKIIIPRLKHAYTVGPRLARILEEKYNTSFITIRNLPLQQADHVSLPSPGQKKVILYQGRLNEGRGLEHVILAMHRINNAGLWLAGEGDLSVALRELVRRERLENKVRFLGYLQPEALRKITLQAHIGLNLLENKGLSYYYSLANKTFDYIQAGLPSLQMDFPEYRALQEEYEVFVLVDKLEVSEIAGKLSRLLKDEELWVKLHQNCLKAREALCWEKETGKLESFYQKTIFGLPAK